MSLLIYLKFQKYNVIFSIWEPSATVISAARASVDIMGFGDSFGTILGSVDSRLERQAETSRIGANGRFSVTRLILLTENLPICHLPI